ncbi:hypothetical protein [Streptomyces sp. NBC_00057]|uniref:hypothetical protein n=1 Tax=Streptomyces sp. NBC_00057 TaxID=2975634 RepID=UPI003254C5C8
MSVHQAGGSVPETRTSIELSVDDRANRQALFERRCGTLAMTVTPGAFAFGLRLVAWDGTALDVPDTPANAAEFGFTGRDGVNQSGHPQVRLMALTECGTHALVEVPPDLGQRVLTLRG